MATQLQLRRGTTTEHNTFTGAVGEVTVDTTKEVLVVHDGTTVGGFPQAARANADGTISLIKKDGTSAGSINSSGLFNNTLTSTNTNQALTAAQGKVLKDLADTKQASATAFGIGQTYQDMTASRAQGTTYTNSTGKPILVCIQETSDATVTITVNSVIVARKSGSGCDTSMTVVVPNGGTYSMTGSSIYLWVELR